MEEEKATKLKKKHKFLSPAIKEEILDELRNGSCTIPELAELYSIGQSTIYDWKYKLLSIEPVDDRAVPSEHVRQIANEVFAETLSIQEAVEKYKLSNSLGLKYWVNRIRRESRLLNKEILLPKDDIAVMSKRKIKSESEEVKQLQNALEASQMRVMALETLIEVAERELGIKIKKKSGTRQSKK